jgi:hypothetical protein
MLEVGPAAIRRVASDSRRWPRQESRRQGERSPADIFRQGKAGAREAAEKLERLDAGDLLREIAHEWARRAVDGRKLLVWIAKMTDDEIKGLAAVRRVLIGEPVIRSAPARLLAGESAAKLRGATSELGWMDVLHLPSGGAQRFVEAHRQAGTSRRHRLGAHWVVLSKPARSAYKVGSVIFMRPHIWPTFTNRRASA